MDVPRAQRLGLALELLALGKKLCKLYIIISTTPETVDPLHVTLMNTGESSRMVTRMSQANPEFKQGSYYAADSYNQITINVTTQEEVISTIVKTMLEKEFPENTLIVLKGIISDQDCEQIKTALPFIKSSENLTVWLDKSTLNNELLIPIYRFNFALYEHSIREAHKTDKSGFGSLIVPILALIIEYAQKADYNEIANDTTRENKRLKTLTGKTNPQFFPEFISQEISISEHNRLFAPMGPE